MLNHNEKGFQCYMWWPKDVSLIPVESMKINEKNCAFLEV